MHMLFAKNLLGYLSIALFASGLVCKLQHWPGAGIMLILGLALLNFGYLPLLFLVRKRRELA